MWYYCPLVLIILIFPNDPHCSYIFCISCYAACILYLCHKMSHQACLAPLNRGQRQSKAVVGLRVDPSLLLSLGRPGIL